MVAHISELALMMALTIGSIMLSPLLRLRCLRPAPKPVIS